MYQLDTCVWQCSHAFMICSRRHRQSSCLTDRYADCSMSHVGVLHAAPDRPIHTQHTDTVLCGGGDANIFGALRMRKVFFLHATFARSSTSSRPPRCITFGSRSHWKDPSSQMSAPV